MSLSEGIDQDDLLEQLIYLIESQIEINITLNILLLLNIVFYGYTEE